MLLVEMVRDAKVIEEKNWAKKRKRELMSAIEESEREKKSTSW